MKNLNIFSSVTEYENTKSGGVLNVPNVSFVDEDSSVKYLLKNIPTYNGYEYVDLGLPSGLKWAKCNVEQHGIRVSRLNQIERFFSGEGSDDVVV